MFEPFTPCHPRNACSRSPKVTSEPTMFARICDVSCLCDPTDSLKVSCCFHPISTILLKNSHFSCFMNKIMHFSNKNLCLLCSAFEPVIYPAVLLCNQMRANFQHGGQRGALSSSIVFSFFCAAFRKMPQRIDSGKNQKTASSMVTSVVQLPRKPLNHRRKSLCLPQKNTVT